MRPPEIREFLDGQGWGVRIGLLTWCTKPDLSPFSWLKIMDLYSRDELNIDLEKYKQCSYILRNIVSQYKIV
jgi:hypothetical protein